MFTSNVGKSAYYGPLSYDGPRGFEKHSIVLDKLTNTISRYPQEGTIYALFGIAASRLT